MLSFLGYLCLLRFLPHLPSSADMCLPVCLTRHRACVHSSPVSSSLRWRVRIRSRSKPPAIAADQRPLCYVRSFTTRCYAPSLRVPLVGLRRSRSALTWDATAESACPEASVTRSSLIPLADECPLSQTASALRGAVTQRGSWTEQICDCDILRLPRRPSPNAGHFKSPLICHWFSYQLASFMANEGERYGCDKRQKGPSVTVTMAPATFADSDSVVSSM